VKRPPLKRFVALELHRVAVRDATGRFRSANPRVFGSAAHGADKERRDLDIVVDALPEATLFDLGELGAELEELLGVSLDLLTPGNLPPKLRAAILVDGQRI
jgi:predicted nucleotidyltransferase